MTDPPVRGFTEFPSRSAPSPYTTGSSANLADILERVLDKGIVIAGDIRINLLDIELLTVKLRLLVASVDKAKEMGIDWWEHDPSLSSRAHDGRRLPAAGSADELARENERLRAELAAVRDANALPPATESGRARADGVRTGSASRTRTAPRKAAAKRAKPSPRARKPREP